MTDTAGTSTTNTTQTSVADGLTVQAHDAGRHDRRAAAIALLEETSGDEKATGEVASESDRSLDSADGSSDSQSSSEDGAPEISGEESAEAKKAADKKEDGAEEKKEPRIAELVRREAKLRRDQEAFKVREQHVEAKLQQADTDIQQVELFVQRMRTDIVGALELAGFSYKDLTDALIQHMDDKTKPVGVQPSRDRAIEDRFAAMERKLAEYETKEQQAKDQRLQQLTAQYKQQHLQTIQERVESQAERWPNVFERDEFDRVYAEASRAFDQNYPNPRPGDAEEFVREYLDECIDWVEKDLAAKKAAKQARLKGTGNRDAQGDGRARSNPRTLSNRVGSSPAAVRKDEPPQSREERRSQALRALSAAAATADDDA